MQYSERTQRTISILANRLYDAICDFDCPKNEQIEYCVIVSNDLDVSIMYCISSIEEDPDRELIFLSNFYMSYYDEDAEEFVNCIDGYKIFEYAQKFGNIIEMTGISLAD